MNDEVLTADEAAKYLKVTKQTVLKLFKEGKMSGRRVGRVYRFLKTDLEKYISGKIELHIQ